MEEDDLISRLSLDSNNSGSSKVRVTAAGDNQFTFELNEDIEGEEEEEEDEEEEEEMPEDLTERRPALETAQFAAEVPRRPEEEEESIAE